MINKTHAYSLGQGYGNQTLLADPSLCTLETCDLSMSSYNYIPTLAGNAIFAAIFGVYVLIQLFFGIKHKTWGYMIAIIAGLLLETIGYVTRVLLNGNPFEHNFFLVSLVTLTIAPALLTASIYLCLGRIVNVYGESLSFFKPRTYTVVFCAFDLVCLILQAVGGAIASTANTLEDRDLGKNIMVAGLITQVVALSLFLLAGGDFAIRVWNGRGKWNPKYSHIVNSFLFKFFLGGLFTATVTILARSVYRCVELWGGFDSELFEGHEVTFMIMEGVMCIIACSCLTFLHPAICFQGAFHDATFHFRSKNSQPSKAEQSISDEESYLSSHELRNVQPTQDARE